MKNIFAIMIIFVFFGCSIKDTMQKCENKDGQSCYKMAIYSQKNRQGHTRIADYHHQACQADYIESCAISGSYYFYGLQVRQDIQKAFLDLTKACDDQNKLKDYDKAISCFYLGQIYENGSKEISKNKSVAVNLYEKSSQIMPKNYQNYGLLRLADLYYIGDGVSQDKDKAVKTYEQLCENGTFEACDTLSKMYIKGEYFQRNLTKAEEYCLKADYLDKRSVIRKCYELK